MSSEQHRDIDASTQSIDEYLDVLLELGFELILEEVIASTKDKLWVLWRQGVLLFTYSYNGKKIDKTSVYLNYQKRSDDARSYEILPECSFGCKDTDIGLVYDVRKDVRQGLQRFLDALRESGTILEQWKVRPFLWLLTWEDTQIEGYDYAAINEARIAKFPEHVRIAITPKSWL
jgi:hypothetical protein